MNTIKKSVLEEILKSMKEIKNNLEYSTDKEDVETNAKAMLALAKAYKLVSESKRKVI